MMKTMIKLSICLMFLYIAGIFSGLTIAYKSYNIILTIISIGISIYFAPNNKELKELMSDV